MDFYRGARALRSPRRAPRRTRHNFRGRPAAPPSRDIGTFDPNSASLAHHGGRSVYTWSGNCKQGAAPNHTHGPISFHTNPPTLSLGVATCVVNARRAINQIDPIRIASYPERDDSPGGSLKWGAALDTPLAVPGRAWPCLVVPGWPGEAVLGLAWPCLAFPASPGLLWPSLRAPPTLGGWQPSSLPINIY